MNSLAKKFLLVPAAFGLLAMATGCASAAPIAHYTGEAIVKSHAVFGGDCRANVKMPDGKSGAVTVGKKTVCNDYTDGITVKIENGKYQGKA